MFVFKLGFLNLLYCTSLTAFALMQYMSSDALPVVQMLHCCVCPLVCIVLIGCGPDEVRHPSMTQDDSDFEFVAIFYNGSKEYIISNKIKLAVFAFFYLVMKIPNFWVIPL